MQRLPPEPPLPCSEASRPTLCRVSDANRCSLPNWHTFVADSSLGQGFEPRPGRPKLSRADQLHHPPQARRPCRYYDASVPAPTVVILAAGEGTRMRSSVPKVLHPILGLADDPVADPGRQRGRGRPRRGHRRAQAPARRAAARRRRGRRPAGAQGHRRRGQGRRVPHRSGRAGPRDQRRRAADHSRGRRRAFADAHTKSGAAATMATMELDDPPATVA